VLNHNRVVACMVPGDTFEAILERLDDQALAEIARARAGGPTIRVSWMIHELEFRERKAGVRVKL
jgi:antitoxin StbD